MKKAIIEYYDYTLPFYNFFWHKDGGSYALHYGFWERKTRSLNEALLNTNRFLADKAQIKRNTFVLDAGCGIGGSAIWLAKNLGAKATGISISEKQIKKAKELETKNKTEGLTSFFVMDYLKTKFASASFDVVWAIESVCHAQNKKYFLKEAYRILKPGGRIIIADGFMRRNPKNEKEQKIIKDFCHGFAVPNVAGIGDFEKSMKTAGFNQVKYWDKTKDVLPSSKRLYAICLIGYPISRITEALKLTSPILTKNNLAGLAQYEAIISGVGAYCVFYGKK